MTLDEFRLRHRIMDRLLADSAVIRDIHRVYQLIDGKCSALIGHVSLMIAATSFLYASTDVAEYKLAFLLEAACYLVVAVLLLGTIGLSMYRVKLPHSTDVMDDADIARLEEFFAASCKSRVRAYMLGHSATIAITVAVIATVASWFVR